MKKLKTICISIICVISLIALSGCMKNKTPISAETFKETMKNKGYSVSSSTTQHDSSDDVAQSYIAISPNFEYQMEYVSFNSDISANEIYNIQKQELEKEKDAASIKIYSTYDLANYSKYTLKANGKYKVMSRIDNTIIYLTTKSDNSDAANTLLDELGY